MCYFDADDPSINDDLYRNIRDIECVFAKTRNADGSPKEGYASATALDIGKVIVSAYFERYYKEPEECPANEEEAKEKRASGTSLFTSSFISLNPQKLAEFQSGVEKLAKDLLLIKESNASLFNSIYTKYIRQDINSLENCKGLAYCGSFARLNDLGWLCVDIGADSSLSVAHDSARALLNLLENGDDKLIIYAWGGKRAIKDNVNGQWTEVTDYQLYLTGKKDFISQKNVAVAEDIAAYGLTIVGSLDGDWPDKYNMILHYDDWTGFSESWGKVIKTWWDYSRQ